MSTPQLLLKNFRLLFVDKSQDIIAKYENNIRIHKKCVAFLDKFSVVSTTFDFDVLHLYYPKYVHPKDASDGADAAAKNRAAIAAARDLLRTASKPTATANTSGLRRVNTLLQFVYGLATLLNDKDICDQARALIHAIPGLTSMTSFVLLGPDGDSRKHADPGIVATRAAVSGGKVAQEFLTKGDRKYSFIDGFQENFADALQATAESYLKMN